MFRLPSLTRIPRLTLIQKYGPCAAALLNGAFIQATEMDDYHSVAPLHSASVILPALFAAAESDKATKLSQGQEARGPSGLDFLLSAIVGFETGPRAGLALNGAEMLTQGWHSGPIFGAPTAAAATSKLLGLNADNTESAIGIACTQAGGLMSAQYEGMVKRMQHAFAARNGLFATLLARTGYVGIKKVFERPYGGFLSQFSLGSTTEPKYHVDEVTKGLGETWEINRIRVKLHACVGGCHGQIELLERMQQQHPARFSQDKLHEIKSISVGLSAAIYAHDGWDPDVRPMTSTGAQMCAAYIGATQLVDRQVLLKQFADHMLDRDDVWDLTYKTSCYHDPTFDRPNWYCGARIKIEFEDGFVIEDMISMPKGYDPQVSNQEILEKYRKVAITVIDETRMAEIESMVLSLDKLDDVTKLAAVLGQQAKGAFTK